MIRLITPILITAIFTSKLYAQSTPNSNKASNSDSPYTYCDLNSYEFDRLAKEIRALEVSSDGKLFSLDTGDQVSSGALTALMLFLAVKSSHTNIKVVTALVGATKSVDLIQDFSLTKKQKEEIYKGLPALKSSLNDFENNANFYCMSGETISNDIDENLILLNQVFALNSEIIKDLSVLMSESSGDLIGISLNSLALYSFLKTFKGGYIWGWATSGVLAGVLSAADSGYDIGKVMVSYETVGELIKLHQRQNEKIKEFLQSINRIRQIQRSVSDNN
ncbi:MAG: hypothetical protein VX642_07920 [Bdellovibrionota bacterium]|nr:hypothetical protein [Bdellovibrionota bacterium]